MNNPSKQHKTQSAIPCRDPFISMITYLRPILWSALGSVDAYYYVFLLTRHLTGVNNLARRERYTTFGHYKPNVKSAKSLIVLIRRIRQSPRIDVNIVTTIIRWHGYGDKVHPLVWRRGQSPSVGMATGTKSTCCYGDGDKVHTLPWRGGQSPLLAFDAMSTG